MTRGRPPGVPSAGIPMVYSANETEPAPPRRLPTSMDEPYAEIRDGRVWLGKRRGTQGYLEISFTPAEFRALGPQLRAVFTALKETP